MGCTWGEISVILCGDCGVYILEDNVARERIAGIECSHIEMNVDIKRRRERWKKSCGFVKWRG